MSWGEWCVPTLSLEAQLNLEACKREAASAPEDALRAQIVTLVELCHQQKSILECALGRVIELEATIALQNYELEQLRLECSRRGPISSAPSLLDRVRRLLNLHHR